MIFLYWLITWILLTIIARQIINYNRRRKLIIYKRFLYRYREIVEKLNWKDKSQRVSFLKQTDKILKTINLVVKEIK